MIDPVRAFLQANAIQTPVFPANSRYYGIGTAVLETAGGRTAVYVKRRFISQPGQFTLVQEHSVVEGDRVDSLANSYLGDPEQYWRLCDANVAMRPEELTDTVGRKLRITLPEGLAGLNA